MDDTGETGQSFKLLPKDIANISTAELVQKVHGDVPTGSKEVYLQAFMTWLHGRLSVIDNSDEGIFNKEVDGWYSYLTEFGFEGEAIVQGFDEWKRYQSVAEPSSSRRLNFAGMRISHLYSRSSAPEGAISGDTATTQPDRALLAFDDVDPDDEEPAVEDDGSLSFLTGPNAMVHGESSDHHGLSSFPVVRRTGSPPSPSPLSNRFIGRNKISSNYICNRCGGRGHAIAECPTNMDPSYDVPPYAEYVCKICGAESLHYVTLCPQNEDPDSITQQRIRRARKFGRAAGRHGPARRRLHSPARYGWDDEPLRYQEEDARLSGWRNLSPQPRERYPRRDTRSPRRRTRSPRRSDLSPHPRTRSPHRNDPSPHPPTRPPRRYDPSPHPRTRSPCCINPSPHPPNRDHDRLTGDHPRRRSVSPLPRARHPRPSSPRPLNRSSRTPARQEGRPHSGYGESRNAGGGMSSDPVEGRPHHAYGESRNARGGMSSDPVEGRDASQALSEHLSSSLSFLGHGAEPNSSPEEGETFSDEADDQAENYDDWAWVQGPGGGFAEALDDLISEMSDIWLPEKDPIHEEPVIEFGVTPKGLDGEPAYHPKVVGLFRDKANVWTHRIKRGPAWALWTETGSAKAGAKKDDEVATAPPTGEALDENMDLGLALPQDGLSMQQKETGATENQLQISNTGEGLGEDRDVVMEDTGSTEELNCALPGLDVGQDDGKDEVLSDDSKTAFTGLWGKFRASSQHTGVLEERHSSSAKERLRELEKEMAKVRAKISLVANGGTDQ
ncbi:hypothetical protein B0T18DRAFT_392332 [Schizothecium vesticola]|uniref:CCHC-type domain-containing protein n=1 Tax=Schizothecium vesticola TaxID=314040 RepID=A0AA40EQG6_9PEZI|nr:hypothetical protein B0T18DRAFT_392332 [Schizothecium vesticola]